MNGPPITSTVTYPGARRPDRSSWVDSDGLRLATYEWGDPDGAPVLLAHGGFDFAGTFDLLAPRLADRGLRAISWDQRGHGNSDPDIAVRLGTGLIGVLEGVSVACRWWGPSSAVLRAC